MNEEAVQELIKWIAVLIKAAGGQIFIPRRVLEEIDHTDVIQYENDIEGNVLLKLRRNLVLDVSGYTEDIAPYNPET